jgi:predicted aldo/keto reductase-like oxidoreductase
MSAIAIFGAAAFYEISQDAADRAIQQVLEAGVNHIDVAPSYGQAEERLGPWMGQLREQFFLGCKTTERSKAGAAQELHRSLERLRVDSFDLYQLHAVNTITELDQVTGPGGALEAAVEAREEGLTRYIGITGHGLDVPAIFLEALRRFDFDSVLFPINFVQYANPEYRHTSEELLRQCQVKDVGVMVIKSIARGPWGDKSKNYSPWYEPFDDPDLIQKGVNFALSQPVTGICTAADVTLLPLILQSCENFRQISAEEQEQLIAKAADYEPLFA